MITMSSILEIDEMKQGYLRGEHLEYCEKQPKELITREAKATQNKGKRTEGATDQNAEGILRKIE